MIVDMFEVWPITLLLFVVLLGLMVGSFLNVVSYRLPIMIERAWRAQCARARPERRAGAGACRATAAFDLVLAPLALPELRAPNHGACRTSRC